MYKMPTQKLYDSLEVLFNVMVRDKVIELDPTKTLNQQREDTCQLLTKVIEGTFGEDKTPEDLFRDRESLNRVAIAMKTTLDLVQNPEMRKENPEMMQGMIKGVMALARSLKRVDEPEETPKTDDEIKDDARDLATELDEELDQKQTQTSEIDQQRELDNMMTYGLTKGGQIANTQGPQLGNMKGAVDQGPAYSSRGGSIHRGKGLGDEGAIENAELDEAAEENLTALGDLLEEVEKSLESKGYLHPKHMAANKPSGAP